MSAGEATAAGTDTRAVVTSYFEAIGRRDRNAQTNWYAADASGRIHGVLGPAGLAEMREFFSGVYDAFPDFTLQVLDLVVEGDRASVRWRVTGTFNGNREFEGLLPTGRTVDVEGCDMVWVREGKIVRIEAYYDTATMARQVGAMPPRGSMGEKGMLTAVNAATRARAEIDKRRNR